MFSYRFSDGTIGNFVDEVGPDDVKNEEDGE